MGRVAVFSSEAQVRLCTTQHATHVTSHTSRLTPHTSHLAAPPFIVLCRQTQPPSRPRRSRVIRYALCPWLPALFTHLPPEFRDALDTPIPSLLLLRTLKAQLYMLHPAASARSLQPFKTTTTQPKPRFKLPTNPHLFPSYSAGHVPPVAVSRVFSLGTVPRFPTAWARAQVQPRQASQHFAAHAAVQVAPPEIVLKLESVCSPSFELFFAWAFPR
jgi:hypothetical protein